MGLYPLKFVPIYKAKVWGGRALEKLGRHFPDGQLIGESWEVADLGGISPGAVGGESLSRVGNGPLVGRTLRELIGRFGPELLGTVPLNNRGEFPLLLKYLDARQNLSVQVHPSPAYARRHPDAHLKSEAWYIVDAQPGAVIYKGVREGVDPATFRRAIDHGGVEDLLQRVPARPGDCHYLPSGTCHALGAGIVVAEVQTASDTTFRVYDWGRPAGAGRELHVEQAMECITFAPPDVARHEPHTRFDHDGFTVEPRINCEHFRVEKFTAQAGVTLPIVRNHHPAIWMVLRGSGRIIGTSPGVAIGTGETILLPASLHGAVLALESAAEWLEVTFPSAMGGLIA